jgi:hypothetical protein
LFARLYESTTIRSRNFRIWVIGQAVEPTTGTNADMKVLAEVRRNFTVFAEPGERLADGTVNSAKFKTKVISINDF